MLRVATEELIRPLPGERDGDVLGGEAGEDVEAKGREVGNRLVEMPYALFELQCILRNRQLQLVVLAAEGLGHPSRVGELVCFVFAKPQGERDYGTARRIRHQRDDQAQVDSPREHCP
jgi:hypothetical protein